VRLSPLNENKIESHDIYLLDCYINDLFIDMKKFETYDKCSIII
jgi:hypothetical protein